MRRSEPRPGYPLGRKRLPEERAMSSFAETPQASLSNLLPRRLFFLVVAARGFANNVRLHFGGTGGLQLGGHAAQGDTEYIAVM